MHNLATINGRVAMAYQGETPWHKLGNRIKDGDKLSVAAALTVGNLNWQVTLADMFLSDGRLVKNRKAVLRDIDNAQLGTVGPQFTPIQNNAAFEILQPAIDNFGITIESAGALGNGARTWMLAKLPIDIAPIPGDDIRGYFLIQNGHDGTASHLTMPTPIRVVCQNTLNAATTSGKAMMRITHKKSAADRLDFAAKLITQMVAAMKETETTFAQLAAQRLDTKGVIAYVESVFPQIGTELTDATKDKRLAVAHLVYNGKGSDLAGSNATTGDSTLWGVYNAVTEYFDHARPGAAKAASAKKHANESALFGAGALVKQLALSKARQLVAA